MKKNDIKAIRDIASRLPKVLEAHASGGEWDIESKDGDKGSKWEPNIYNVEVNHERRLRKAYQSLGMEGVKNYLNSIQELQKQRNEKFGIGSGDRGVLPE
jgi:hypothetical protein